MRTGRHFVLVRWTRPFPRTGGALRAAEMVRAAKPGGKGTTRKQGGASRRVQAARPCVTDSVARQRTQTCFPANAPAYLRASQ